MLETIWHFVKSNALLASGFFISLGLYLWYEWQSQQVLRHHTIQAVDLVLAMNHEKAEVYDLRPKAQFEAGHILGAKCLTESAWAKKQSAWLSKKPSHPLYLIASQDKDAEQAIQALQEAGISIRYLKGGIPAWVEAGLPLSKTTVKGEKT